MLDQIGIAMVPETGGQALQVHLGTVQAPGRRLVLTRLVLILAGATGKE
jgi:hypothetical protein